MPKREPGDPGEGIGFNMTPMIDVVFQLIIFLMLANDLSRRDIEELTLPVAFRGEEDTGREKQRVIVNLLRNEGGRPPTLRVQGRDMDLEGFRAHLAPIADRSREGTRPWASEVFVLIRADARSRWQDVQWVMQACADPGIRAHRLQFATTEPGAGGGR